MGDKVAAKKKEGAVTKSLQKNIAKKTTPIKRPAGKTAEPANKFRKGADGQKTPAKKPFVKKAAQGQKPVVKKRFTKDSSKTAVKKPDDEKPKWFEMKKKDRKKMRQQQDNKFYQLQHSVKKLWEKLRRSDVRSDERNRLAEQLHQLLKGNIVNVVEAHDTSRVVECLYANASPEIKNLIFDEVKEKLLHYAKCKYAKNLILAFLRHGCQVHKDAIYKAAQTRVPELFLHKEAAQIISTLYEDVCNNKKKAELAQTFYSKELVYFKNEDATTFKAVYDSCTEKLTKENMLTDFKETLVKLTDKGVIKYGLYHMLLQQLFEVLTDKAERLDMIKQIQHILVEILHTKEGMQVALQCIWHSGAKERKAIVRSFKPFVTRIATDDQGHKVLMGLFDAVDDTVLLNQVIISEVMKNREDLLKNKFGAKVLVYLMVGRDPCLITPDTIELLKQGDSNENSKKEPEVRRKELRKMIQQPLIETICENFEGLVKEGETSVAVRDIILAADEDFKVKAMAKVCELLKTPYVVNSEDHFVENAHGNFFLKKLLLSDKEKEKARFAQILIDHCGETVVRSWWKCNRGAFLCLSLLEMKDDQVKSWAKNALSQDKAALSKEKSKGAEILLQKL